MGRRKIREIEKKLKTTITLSRKHKAFLQKKYKFVSRGIYALVEESMANGLKKKNGM